MSSSSYNIAFDSIDTETRSMVLQFQYKKLMLYGPTLGIYAIPNVNSDQIWSCLIFVRHGYYKGGKFKFQMDFRDFPAGPPTVYFKAGLFHALIDQQNGLLDLSALINEPWLYDEGSMLYRMIKFLPKMFTARENLTNIQSFNPAAAKLLESNLREFMLKAMKCAEDSCDDLSNSSEEQMWNCQQVPAREFESIRQSLMKICASPGDVDEKVQRFLYFLG